MTSRLGRRAGMVRRAFLKKIGLAGAAVSAAGLLDASKARAAPSTLRWSSAQNPGTLDTLTNQFDYAFPPFNTVYEGLTRYPPGDKWQAVNTLAESLEFVVRRQDHKLHAEEGNPLSRRLWRSRRGGCPIFVLSRRRQREALPRCNEGRHFMVRW